MRLVYVENVRLPTEKAHGHAIIKSCEAFARLGADVELWHPQRHQNDPLLRGRTIFEFYGVEPSFAVRTLRNMDIVQLETWLPGWLYRPLFVLHGAAWGAYVARRAARNPVDLYVTRAALVAWWLTRKRLPTVLDVHSVTSGSLRRILRRLADAPSLLSFVALTEGNRERLISIGIPPDRVVVSGSAVDLHQYEDLPSRDQCRAMHQLPLDRPIVGYVGRFHTFGQEKGIPELIRAMGILKSRLNPFPLLLCVGGPMEPVPDYLSLSREVGLDDTDIRFVDHVPAPEVPTWVRSLDIGAALYPSADHYANFASPLKVFEYLAARVPVLASDLPAMHEAIGSAPARFVPEGDLIAIAAALESLMFESPGNNDESSPGHIVQTWEDRAKAILSASRMVPKRSC